jgi:hypothetical protein
VLFSHAPDTMLIVAAIGALTALMAGTIGLVQNDIKRVLAYSTISQLGYMFLAMGVGAFGAGIFHLYTHAFFKALLFLGSGAVIHALHGEQDIRNMGGLRRYLPVTYWTFVIGAIAIAGVPPLAGFFERRSFSRRSRMVCGWWRAHVPAAATYVQLVPHLSWEERFGRRGAAGSRARGTHPGTRARPHTAPPAWPRPMAAIAGGISGFARPRRLHNLPHALWRTPDDGRAGRRPRQPIAGALRHR